MANYYRLIESLYAAGCCVFKAAGPYKLLSVVNTIHIQMRLTLALKQAALPLVLVTAVLT